jgi:hypothetical protein
MESEGVIQDPATKETKRFHRDEKSWTRDPKVFVDTGEPVPEEPALLKTRVHLRKDTTESYGRSYNVVGWEHRSPLLGSFCHPQRAFSRVSGQST